MKTSAEDKAREAYLAYGSVTDHKNYQGLPMPTFDNLTPKIQAAWIAATQKVEALVKAEEGLS
jgi:hypothetical protein